MKKIIKLKESDIEIIVKRVLSEQGNMFGTAGLGMDSALSSKKTPAPKQKVDINPKKLKVGDGGKSNPKQIADVKALQQKLMDLKLLKTDTMVPTGYFGPLTQKALDAYNGTGSVVTSKEKVDPKDKTKTTTTPNAGFIIVFSFPDYQPAVPDTWFNRNIVKPFSSLIANEEENLDEQIQSGSGGKSSKDQKMMKLDKVGHGGCIVITSDGNSTLYEFGRYDSNTKGSIRKKNLGRIAKIQNGKLMNAKAVATTAKRRTEGDGPRLAMDCVVRELPNPSAAISFARVSFAKEIS
jgi:peptidoglycan hydrolase-like protein with peptidoglycan-binding domain